MRGGCAASRNVVARGVYRQETWSSCRCSRLAVLSFGGELASRIKSKPCSEKSSGLAPWVAPWAARTCWTVRMVWTARMEVVGPGRWPGRSLQPQIISRYRVLRKTPAVNRCLPFALEDCAWVNYCCSTAVFTESMLCHVRLYQTSLYTLPIEPMCCDCTSSL